MWSAGKPLLGWSRLNAVALVRMSTERVVAVRREPKSGRFQLKFTVQSAELRVSREFTLDRRVDETAEALLNRIRVNIEKSFGKKFKKAAAKQEAEAAGPVKISAELRRQGRAVPPEVTCEQLFFDGEPQDVTFHFLDLPFTVAVNVPYVVKLLLPKVVVADLPVYPLKLNIRFGLKENASYRWLSSGDGGATWLEVGSSFTYRPTASEVGKLLRVECTPRGGDPSTDTSTGAVQPSPGRRPYQDRHELTEKETNYPDFRVVSYNVLADRYAETEAANTELYPYCPREVRTWSYRRALIVDELVGYNADVLCLQEVDTKAFEYDLTAALRPRFKGVFNKKYSMDEGVATFFNRDRYKLLSSECCYLGAELDTLELFADVWETVRANEGLSERLRGLGMVAQAVVLQERTAPERLLVVGNTHLYFHPDADHIRLLQGGLYSKFLLSVVDKLRSSRPTGTISLLVAGDFNSVPSCGIFGLFTTGTAPADHPDWRSKEGEEIEGLELRHPLPLASAYDPATTEYTNFTQSFADVLDYIFYSTDSLRLDRALPLYSEAELRQHTALPSPLLPSDHIALVADLSWAST